MNLEQLDSHQLQQLESRLFEEFTDLDQLIADKQRQLRQIEAILTAVATARQAKETGSVQEIGPPLQEVDVDRSVSPPVYVDERLALPEDPSTSQDDVYRSGPFEIRRDESGEVDTVTCNLGQHVLVVERSSETTASWGIREKTNIASILHCLSPQSLAGSSSP